MTVFLDLFSGIGGFALGVYRAGLRFDRHYFSEIDGYAARVYHERFPDAKSLGDIRSVDYRKLPKGEYLVTGGFPCQPHSSAGKRKGAGDERDLWPECTRMLRELRPAVALFENVPGLFVSNRGEFFNRILSNIFEIGYDAEWQIISAQDAGAPHLRKRVWIVAYTKGLQRSYDGIMQKCPVERASMAHAEGERCGTRRAEPEGQQGKLRPSGSGCSLADTQGELREWSGNTRPGRNGFANSGSITNRKGILFNTQGVRYWEGREEGNIHKKNGRPDGELPSIPALASRWAVEPDVGRVAYGIPFRVDRLKGLGNAVVPQCVEMILSLPVFDRWKVK